MSNIVPAAKPLDLLDFAHDEERVPVFSLRDPAHLGEGQIFGSLPNAATHNGLDVYAYDNSGNVRAQSGLALRAKRLRGRAKFAKWTSLKRSGEESTLGEISGSVDSLAKRFGLELQRAYERDPNVRKAVTRLTTRAKPSQAMDLVSDLIMFITTAGSAERDTQRPSAQLDYWLYQQPCFHVEPNFVPMVRIGCEYKLFVSAEPVGNATHETQPLCGELTKREAKPDPLAGARLRGQRYKIAVFDSEEMLTAKEVSEIFQVTTPRITQMRKERKIFAVLHPLKPRSLRFPRWQLEERVFNVLGDILPVFNDAEGWRIWLFLTSADPVLRDFTPLEVLRGKADDAERQARLDALLATVSSRELVQRAARAYEHGGE